MKIKQGIEKAIEGGWKVTPDNRWQNEKIHEVKVRYSQWLGNPIQRLLKKNRYYWRDIISIKFYTEEVWIPLSDTLLDIDYWKALGMLDRMHDFIDNLALGQDIETAFDNATK